MMNIYLNRFGEQVETVTTKTLLESWPSSARARKAWSRTASVIGTTWCHCERDALSFTRFNDTAAGNRGAGGQSHSR